MAILSADRWDSLISFARWPGKKNTLIIKRTPTEQEGYLDGVMPRLYFFVFIFSVFHSYIPTREEKTN